MALEKSSDKCFIFTLDEFMWKPCIIVNWLWYKFIKYIVVYSVSLNASPWEITAQQASNKLDKHVGREKCFLDVKIKYGATWKIIWYWLNSQNNMKNDARYRVCALFFFYCKKMTQYFTLTFPCWMSFRFRFDFALLLCNSSRESDIVFILGIN